MREKDSNCTFSKCYDGYEAAVRISRDVEFPLVKVA